MPVVKARTDDAYFAPLKNLKLRPGTELYLGLIHHNDAGGDRVRLDAARRYARVDGIGTECGMARGDPARLPALLTAHARRPRSKVGRFEPRRNPPSWSSKVAALAGLPSGAMVAIRGGPPLPAGYGLIAGQVLGGFS